MKLHELSPVPGSHKKPKRLGQGLGSGNGKTAGKGHKGQKARKSPDIKANFEGGQMPLARRIPKRGFSNFRFTVKYEIVNIADLEERFEAGSEVTAKELSELRLISAPDRRSRCSESANSAKASTSRRTLTALRPRRKLRPPAARLR